MNANIRERSSVMRNTTSAPDSAPTAALFTGMATTWSQGRTEASTRLRFCLRMTIAAVSAFAVSHLLNVPLQGLWAVLTAVVVTQMSANESLRETTEYVVGTLGGAVYASVIAVLIPHTTTIALAGLLALAVAPLALAAALSPRLRVAPFTAVLVLLISNQLGEGPIEAALYRLLEVAMGGATAVVVSLLVFPERARKTISGGRVPRRRAAQVDQQPPSTSENCLGDTEKQDRP